MNPKIMLEWTVGLGVLLVGPSATLIFELELLAVK